MINDEMELVRGLGDVDPLADEAFEQARAVLQAAVAVENAPRAVGRRRRSTPRRCALAVSGGLVAGIAAAAVAVALVATSPGLSPKAPAASNRSVALDPSG